MRARRADLLWLLARAFVVTPAAVPSAAQEAPLRLDPPAAISKAQFGGIGSVRELSDGSLLVSDFVDKRLLAVRLDSTETRDVAREGGGPTEFRSLNTLWAGGADTTFMTDIGNGRWLVFVGSAVATRLPMDQPAVALAGSTIRGIDRQGRLVTQKRLARVAIGEELSVDSIAVVRIDRATGRGDTIARIRTNPAAIPHGVQTVNPMLSQAFGVEMTAPEQAIGFEDGWVAVVRLDPYRVDWIDGSGRGIAGKAIEHRRIRVTTAERRAHYERLSASAGRRISMPARGRWPEFADPIVRDAVFAAPDGRLVVRRRQSASDSVVRHDVAARDGALSYFTLPSTARIVGFGQASMYTAEVDDDGLERLVRRAWPPR